MYNGIWELQIANCKLQKAKTVNDEILGFGRTSSLCSTLLKKKYLTKNTRDELFYNSKRDFEYWKDP